MQPIEIYIRSNKYLKGAKLTVYFLENPVYPSKEEKKERRKGGREKGYFTKL